MGKKSILKKLQKVRASPEFTMLAHSVGLPASKHCVSFGVIKKEVAEALAKKHGKPCIKVDEFLLSFMPKQRAKIHDATIGVKVVKREKKYPAWKSKDIFLDVAADRVSFHVHTTSNTPIPKNPKPIHKDYVKDGFFKSREWLELRYLTIVTHGRVCVCCGDTQSTIHVDHIKPRSRYPELQLDIRNLQCLCDNCNIGKSAWDETDWRSPKQKAVAEEVHARK